MEATSKRGRPPQIPSEERARLLAARELDSERWALDQRFKEATLKALQGGSYPFILPPGKKPRTSLLVELGRVGDARKIKAVAKQLEKEASKTEKPRIKDAVRWVRVARLRAKAEEAASRNSKKEPTATRDAHVIKEADSTNIIGGKIATC
jgi:hypothetical protein